MLLDGSLQWIKLNLSFKFNTYLMGKYLLSINRWYANNAYKLLFDFSIKNKFFSKLKLLSNKTTIYIRFI